MTVEGRVHFAGNAPGAVHAALTGDAACDIDAQPAGWRFRIREKNDAEALFNQVSTSFGLVVAAHVLYPACSLRRHSVPNCELLLPVLGMGRAVVKRCSAT